MIVDASRTRRSRAGLSVARRARRSRTLNAPLPREFYARSAVEVAPALLGALIVHEIGPNVRRVGRIVEVEAYQGSEDRACHAARGRTARTEVMFGPPGHAYVFLIYGMYSCFNVVTDCEGRPSAVLVRAIEPIEGIVRGSSGPGRVCLALGIDRRHYGVDLTRPRHEGSSLWIEPGEASRTPVRIAKAPRVNVEYAGSWARKRWRFAESGNRWVSRPWDAFFPAFR